ncbi:MAG: tRNA (adenosine(37)-N6)-dimethylallyltransferase, partial [Ktedonobacterales bacterium]
MVKDADDKGTDTSARDEQRIPLIGLVGPTATGKTALALALAEQLQGRDAGTHAAGGGGIGGCEVVSADSRQIYRLMEIATAKPTPEERARLPHHLIDVVWPDESYTLAQYQADAMAAVGAIWARGRLPLLVGGTGLYVRAVVDGLAIPQVAPSPDLRAELE